MNPDERAIRAVHANWIAAVNAGDLDGLLGMMTHDALFLNPGQAPVGRDDSPPGFSAAHRQATIQCASVRESVVVVGEVAYTVARETLSMTPHDGGATVRLAGHRLTVHRSQPDGRWLLARDAHTLAPVAEPGA